tara:strand:+ start:169 stop:399 length:231 start_codon:yes stop_codon:yes gene_type:complete
MRIIFSDNGGCSIMTPTPDFLSSLPADWSDEEKMIHVANKDLPSETKYEIVDEVPSDRTFRDAWEYTSGPGERTAE